MIVLKPGANVMIHERGELQIIDFGVAAELVSNRDKRSTLIGTPHFMPPELLNNNPFRRLRYGTEVSLLKDCTEIVGAQLTYLG